MESAQVKQEPQVEFLLLLPPREEMRIKTVKIETSENQSTSKPVKKLKKKTEKCLICSKFFLNTSLKKHLKLHELKKSHENVGKNFNVINVQKFFSVKIT
jgi:hypothetical protein